MTEATSPMLLLQLTAQIVSAHTSRNHLTSEALLGLIGSVHSTLATTGIAPPVAETAQPAVPVKKSVFPDHIVCLEDGKKLKMLRRHLMSTFQMVIAHPTSASGSAGSLAASTKRSTSSTEARLALAVLTTERKAA